MVIKMYQITQNKITEICLNSNEMNWYMYIIAICKTESLGTHLIQRYWYMYIKIYK